MRDEPVIARIEHGGMQEAVDEQGAGGLVHLVFDRLAALRNLDHGVDVVRRVGAGRDAVDVHDTLTLKRSPYRLGLCDATEVFALQ